MSQRSKRAREIQDAIRAVLFDSWDPVQIHNEPDWPTDEYDSYIGGVYALLTKQPSLREIANHLSRIEKDAFGFTTHPNSLMGIAKRLSNIDVRIIDDNET